MIQWIIAAALWVTLAITQYSPFDQGQTAKQFLPVFEGMRTAFSNVNRGISGDSAALVAGLAIGDDSRLSEHTNLAMQTIGLSHLTAVSGANCAIVIALVYLLLKRLSLNRLARAILATFALVLYVLLVGPEPSVLRSSLMAVVVLFVIAAGRPAAAPAALALAIIGLLIFSPKMANSVGFALSVSATLGILILAPKLNEILSRRLPGWLSIAISVALAAQISCWPVLLLIQDGVSTYSIVANLLVEPLVAPITVLGLLACLIAPLLPGLAQAIAWIASAFAWPIEALANLFASFPQSTLSWPRGWLGVCLASGVVALTACWLLVKRRRIQLGSALVLLLIGAVFFGSNSATILRSKTWMKGNWDVVACDVGQGDALVIRSQNAVALVDVGKTDKAIKSCLTDLGVSKIDLLVLTHFDQDHVGAIKGAISGRVVKAALVTEFRDDRPAKAIVLNSLRQAGVKIVGAQANMTGNIGRLQWRILSPRAGAIEAEDSNDGSTIVLFSGPEFDLLAMADLGERGQRRLAPQLGHWSATRKPLILKVSHHGSADQYAELIEELRPDYALVSVGRGNSYGHPTDRTLALLSRAGAVILRTDQLGSISLAGSKSSNGELEIRASG